MYIYMYIYIYIYIYTCITLRPVSQIRLSLLRFVGPKSPGRFPESMRIKPLKLKILLESNPSDPEAWYRDWLYPVSLNADLKRGLRDETLDIICRCVLSY